MVKTIKRYNRRKTTRNKGYRHKKLSKKRSGQVGGNRCSKVPEIIQLFSIIWDKFINYWGEAENWKLEEVNTSIPDTFTPKDKRRYGDNLRHHPVILNILRSHFVEELDNGQDTTLNNVLQLYCGEWTIKLPEYCSLMFLLKDERIDENNISGIITKLREEYFNTGGNKLQPRNWQIFVLHYFIDHPLYRAMNELQKHDDVFPRQQKWKQYIRLFSGDTPFINLHQLGSGHEDDLDARAGIIAERCVRNANLTKLYTMDGHGRFICSFLIQLFHRDPEFFVHRDFNIYVCDVDKEVNLWHMITMPIGVTVDRDIFDILEETIESRSDEIETTLIYANFSGASGQREQITTAFGTYNLMNCLDNLVVSVANVRGAVTAIRAMTSDLRRISDKINTDITDRPEFPTIGTLVGVGIGEYSTLVRGSI